ncbi:MAG: helicase IV [Candidatus Lokiarchaeota archaeon]|nr:helicase IV [Candidatus Lokiarchaeota archaeon]
MENIYLTFVILIISLCIIIYIIYRALNWGKKSKRLKAKTYKCLDRHVVKSRAELIIDNLLTLYGIKHIYERTIHINGKALRYDFYLPDFDIYLEYWGLFDKKYLKRKKQKIHLYKKKNLNLVSIEDIDLKDIYKILPKKLSKYTNLEKISAAKHSIHKNRQIWTFVLYRR